ncbi:MAG: hypothetical protein MPW15_27905 [Candidatus Manganitrophus sp.]|nr:hypothetical protein [Candidatus Manganitrophus sp.]
MNGSQGSRRGIISGGSSIGSRSSRASVREVGPRFRLVSGIPWVEGYLDIRIGADVTLNGITTLAGATVWEKPALEIGDDSYIGYQVTITVGPRVRIGRHVLIADRVSLIGYDGHPQDPVERRNHRPAPKRRMDGRLSSRTMPGSVRMQRY